LGTSGVKGEAQLQHLIEAEKLFLGTSSPRWKSRMEVNSNGDREIIESCPVLMTQSYHEVVFFDIFPQNLEIMGGLQYLFTLE
jgi:hypothetical protein